MYKNVQVWFDQKNITKKLIVCYPTYTISDSKFGLQQLSLIRLSWAYTNALVSAKKKIISKRYIMQVPTCKNEISRMLASKWNTATKVSTEVLHPPIFPCWHPPPPAIRVVMIKLFKGIIQLSCYWKSTATSIYKERVRLYTSITSKQVV